MMTPWILAPLLAALPCASARAADKLPAADYLNIPVDVRSLSLGEAAQGAATGAGGLSAAPAALAEVAAQQFYFTHGFLAEGSGSDFISYAVTIAKHHLGLSYYHVGYGSVQGRDLLGNPTLSLGPSDTVYGFSYAASGLGADIGANLKYVESKVVNTARSWTFDVGARYRLGEEWILGVSGYNLSGELKYESDSYPLPTRVAFGGAWKPLENWLVALDVVHPVYATSYVALGGEWVLGLSGAGSLALRLGANTRRADQGFHAGLSAGLGFKLKVMDVDYAFANGGDGGDTHHLGLGYRFGRTGGER